jgi:hypothetical protein
MPLFKNVASQKIAVYAIDKTTGAAKTGDSGAITAYVSLDGGTPAQTNDANPTELSSTNMPGWYVFDMTQSETNCNMLVLAAKSSTPNILIDQVGPIYTQLENIAANVTQISGDATAADNLEAAADGTGYNLGGGAVVSASVTGAVGSVTGAVGSVTAGVTLANDAITAAKIATDAITEIQSGLAIDSTVMKSASYTAPDNASITAIKAKTDNLPASPAAVGSEMTLISAYDAAKTAAQASDVALVQKKVKVELMTAQTFERPESSTRTYLIDLWLLDAPDVAPTISVSNEAGTSRNGNLDSTTMTGITTKHYQSTYTVAAAHALEQLIFAATVTEGGAAEVYGTATIVQDDNAGKIDALYVSAITGIAEPTGKPAAGAGLYSKINYLFAASTQKGEFNKTAGTHKVYKSDNTTVLGTRTISDDGTTQTTTAVS